MKKIILLIFVASNLIAQDWAKYLKPDATFEQRKEAFYNYYKNVPSSWVDDDYARFKRYEAYMDPRSKVPQGVIPAEEIWKAYQELNQNTNKTSQAAAANWSILGPTVLGNLPGLGRVNCVYFDPTNSNTVWIGSASGGLWKSVNQGIGWTNMSNGMPNLGISDVVIDASNPNTMYVSTGDKYAWATSSIGVMKSTNGGVTWATTGLNYTTNQFRLVYHLILDQTNPNVLVAAASDGIWRTQNGGTNWSLVKSGLFYDVEFNTTSTNTLYASSDSIYTSVDNGLTWKSFAASPTFVVNAGRHVSLAVTADNSNYIYVFDESARLFRSTNAGATWTQMTTPTLYTYWNYGTVLTVSPLNRDEVIVGGLTISKSTDGGATWPFNVNSGIHPDHKDFVYFPGSATTLFAANDGGIYKSTNGGLTYSDYSSGLEVTQYYRMGCAANSKTELFGGTQDNGTHKYHVGNWSRVYYGDGTETFVDPLDSNIMYFSTQGIEISKSFNGGATFTYLGKDTGSFYYPYNMHPSNNQIIFKAGNMVKKSTDAGLTWTPISPAIGPMNSMAVSISNPNYIYAASYQNIYKTTTGGGVWTNVTSNIPTSMTNITYIAIHPTNPNHLWVSTSSYTAGLKVYETTNGGTTWTNTSTGLPNVPINCIVHNDNSSNDEIYVGTDIGVYYKDNTMSSWQPYNTNLPAVVVTELEIHYLTNKLRACTYGRGMWETDLNSMPTGIKNKPEVKSYMTLFPNPTAGNITIGIDNPKETITAYKIYDIRGKEVLQKEIADKLIQNLSINTEILARGLYIAEVTTNAGKYVSKFVKE